MQIGVYRLHSVTFQAIAVRRDPGRRPCDRRESASEQLFSCELHRDPEGPNDTAGGERARAEEEEGRWPSRDPAQTPLGVAAGA